MSKPLYQVGQQVIIRDDFTEDDCDGAGYVNEMEAYRGKIVTISDAGNGRPTTYKIEEDNRRWWYAEKQFSPVIVNEEKALNMLISGVITSEEYMKYVGRM